MNNSNVTYLIKKKALDLGFTHIGVAKAEPLDEEKLHLLEWLQSGFHATMEYMSRNVERRGDPRLILPGAKTIIAVAMNYHTPFSHASTEHVGKISRYAWGDDYHDIMGEKLNHLSMFVCELIPDAECKVYVDTGPMMDKAWAVRAGIGWLGKHANVITRDQGSWIFLGEVITTAQLNCDIPIEDFCGTCTRCIQACPTNAIVVPYVIDSNKCISYQTIESKAETIPDTLGERFDNWIYGCDICQDVCPWNSFATETNEIRFNPHEGNVTPVLDELSTLTQDKFSGRFKNSPIKRAKLKGLLRNVRTIKRFSASHIGQ